MRLSQYIERKPERRSGSRRKADQRASVMTHSVFMPMITAWGAALFGLSVVVLPSIAIERIAMVTGLGLSLGDSVTRFAFAGVAAVIGAALCFVIAGAVRSAAIRRADDDTLMSAVHSRHNRPIDPASELGSESLDSPLEGMPFNRDGEDDTRPEPDLDERSDNSPKDQPQPDPHIAANPNPHQESERKPTLGELAKRGYDFEPPEDPSAGTSKPLPKKGKSAKDELVFTHKQFQSALIESCEAATCEAGAEVQEQSAGSTAQSPFAQDPAPETDLPERPEQLDLGEFAQLPGRDAVWVKEQIDPAATPPLMARAARPAVPSAGALEKLRQTPPDELSLVEMVERFAAALHERQRTEREQRPSARNANHDAALVEALKALTVFTSHGMSHDNSAYEQTPKTQADDPRVAATERELREALAKLQDLRGAA